MIPNKRLTHKNSYSPPQFIRPRRISKVDNRYLSAAVYMPAVVVIQHEPNVKAFYAKLVAAGKKPMQAVIA